MASSLRLPPSFQAAFSTSNRLLPSPFSKAFVKVAPPLAFHLPSHHASFSPIRSSAGDPVKVEHAKVEESLLPSGEWPENFSLLNFEDLSKHYEAVLFKAEAQPSTFLADVMSTTIYTARPYQLLEDVDHFFMDRSGLPVIDEELKCIGVLSKKDRSKALKGVSISST